MGDPEKPISAPNSACTAACAYPVIRCIALARLSLVAVALERLADVIGEIPFSVDFESQIDVRSEMEELAEQCRNTIGAIEELERLGFGCARRPGG